MALYTALLRICRAFYRALLRINRTLCRDLHRVTNCKPTPEAAKRDDKYCGLGLFIGLFCGYVGLFMGLFCGYIGLCVGIFTESRTANQLLKPQNVTINIMDIYGSL